MAKYLITQTLLSAFNYIFNCYDGAEHEAYDAFIKTLNREPSETNEAMQRGIDFENNVFEYTNGKAIDDPTVREIGDIVKGSQWQVKAYKDKTIAGIDFLLMAKCDCVKAGEIYDIKRVENYEVGKYKDSPQHSMYLEVIPAFQFTYLISDGQNVYKETYRREDTQEIDGTIKQFINFLESENMLSIYFEKWGAS
jgi:hypothetical protein